VRALAPGGDERVGGVHVAVGEFDAEVACGLFRDVHDDSVSSLGAELRRLRFHVVDQLRPGDSLGEAGVVLHVGSERELPARLVALDEQRIVVRPRGVDSCRESGDPGAGDNQPAVFDDVVGHGYWFAVAKYVGCALGRGGQDSERGAGAGTPEELEAGIAERWESVTSRRHSLENSGNGPVGGEERRRAPSKKRPATNASTTSSSDSDSETS